MAVYQVQSNGQAPPGLSVGDYVNTAGGMYMVAAPGSYGATYNPQSGYWSVKVDSSAVNTPTTFQSMLTSAQKQAKENSKLSQEYAREQMGFQAEQVAQQMAYQTQSAREAMQFSAEQAKLNRQWQERLSGSAHQREVADLIAAGLNPVLSAGGQGASTPSGASASGVATSGSAASGASGTVDNSVTSAIANLLATLMSSEQSVNIAKLQTAATMYAADRGLMGSQSVAGATMAAAATSAEAARYNVQKQTELQKWITENYPSTPWSTVSAIVNAVNQLGESGGNPSSGNAWAKLVSNLGNGLIDLTKKAAKSSPPAF